MRSVRRFTIVCCIAVSVSQLAMGNTSASTESSTTSTTIAETSTTVLPPLTASEISSFYPSRALRFPGYTRMNPPLLPALSGVGRRIVYKNKLQWVWVVDAQNNVLRAIPVSGLQGVPKTGEYKVTSQSVRSFSLDFDGVWFNNMTRFAFGPNGGNIGFHSIPTKNRVPLQSAEQLGSFQGSGCIRMLPEDAKFVFDFAKPGTKVVVIP